MPVFGTGHFLFLHPEGSSDQGALLVGKIPARPGGGFMILAGFINGSGLSPAALARVNEGAGL